MEEVDQMFLKWPSPRDAAAAFGANFDHEMNKAENKLAGQKRALASLSTERERIDREKARRTNREVGAASERSPTLRLSSGMGTS